MLELYVSLIGKILIDRSCQRIGGFLLCCPGFQRLAIGWGVREQVGFDLEHTLGNGITQGSHVPVDAGTDAGDVHGFCDEIIPLVVGLFIVVLIFKHGPNGVGGDRDVVEQAEGFCGCAGRLLLPGFEDFSDLGTQQDDLEIEFFGGVVEQHVLLFRGEEAPEGTGGGIVRFLFGVERGVGNRRQGGSYY